MEPQISILTCTVYFRRHTTSINEPTPTDKNTVEPDGILFIYEYSVNMFSFVYLFLSHIADWRAVPRVGYMVFNSPCPAFTHERLDQTCSRYTYDNEKKFVSRGTIYPPTAEIIPSMTGQVIRYAYVSCTCILSSCNLGLRTISHEQTQTNRVCCFPIV